MKYEIRVNGALADTKPTYKGALALVTLKFHGHTGVTILKNGELLWSSKK